MIAVLLLSLLGTASAACDNHCSGHGTCTSDDVCACFDNWGVGLGLSSGDCSDRICPFEIAWVDTPDSGGNFHKYAECAGRGICQRDTGECACFDGYEGKGCQRSACPNDCSGHGTCEYIEELTFGSVWSDYNLVGFGDQAQYFDHKNWDRHKERACVCDATYGDVDCSKRVCPFGDDVLDDAPNNGVLNQIQSIVFTYNKAETTALATDDLTFALTFKSKLNETFTTKGIVFNVGNLPLTAEYIRLALLRLPNRVIDNCKVTVTNPTTLKYLITVEFNGDAVQGDQHLMVLHDYGCGDGCTPKISGIPTDTRLATMNGGVASAITQTQASDFNSFECGRRGKCDYTTGICKCFSGYSGDNCNTLHALY